MHRLPLIGLPADLKQIGHHPFQAVGEKYLRAVIDGAGGVPLVIPSIQPMPDLRGVLETLDGLMLTGSPSNIEPHHYSDEPSYEGNLHDPARDVTTFGLIPLALEMGLPVLAICRGFQEVNVAFGGALHQKVHEVSGYSDHREDREAPLDEQYAPIHPVHLSEGGLLRRIAGSAEAMVNSLHGQGVRTLGRDLVVEATSPDGLIEAMRLQRGDGAADPFFLAVQWHPEWKVRENAFYLGIFKAFGDACRERASKKR